MSGEKVVRYTAEQMRLAADDREIDAGHLSAMGVPRAAEVAISHASMLRQAAQTEANVAGLVSAMATLLDVIGRTHGRISPLNSSYKDAQAALARFQS